MSQKKSNKKEINSPILNEKKTNSFKTPISGSESSLQLSLEKSFRKQESINPKEDKMRKILEQNMIKYKAMLQETHIPEIFKIICNEIVSKELEYTEVYQFAANRFIEIGQMMENEEEKE